MWRNDGNQTGRVDRFFPRSQTMATQLHSCSRLFKFVVLAGLLHLLLVVAIGVRTVYEDREPTLSGKFVKRRPLQQPVLRRPLLQPAPVRRLERAVEAPRAYARAVAPRPLTTVFPRLLASRQALPSLPPRPLRPSRSFRGSGRLRSSAAGIAIQAADHVDLGLELLDVAAFDTGRYRALVVQDLRDKGKLQGFVRFTAVEIRSASENTADFFEGMPVAVARRIDEGIAYFPDWRHSANVRSLRSLAMELEAETGLNAVVDENVTLDAAEVLSSPFILLTSLVEFEPTESEVAKLGRYLTSGGFAYVEQVGSDVHGWVSGTYPDLISLRSLVRRSLATQGLREGRDWSFEPLSMDHPIFHCYYDVDTLPVNYWQATYADREGQAEQYYNWPYPTDENIPRYIEGIHLDGRLVLVYSQQSYRDFWSKRPERALTEGSEYILANWNHVPHHRPSSTPAIRLGINVVVYALTQEGSLARRFVKSR